jgi:hypothetical protein
MKKIFAVMTAVIFSLSLLCPLIAAQEKAAAQRPARLPGRVPRSEFSMVFGTISKIDDSDPANPKMEVVSETDSKPHEVAVTQWTNVTKMTDFSDLKVGDTVRVMVRKVQDKEVAVNIMYGKMRPSVARQPARPLGQAEKQGKK